MSAQIEIGVVGEVYHGGAVFDGSPHLESEGTVVGPDVAGIGIEFAGIALFAVVRGVMECHRVVEHVLNLPYTILEAGGSAVQGVRTVVYGQRIGVAVEFEVAAGYTVGIAARNLAGAGSVGEVIVGIGVAYHHIGHTAFCIRHNNTHDTGTEATEHHLGANGVGDGQQCYFAVYVLGKHIDITDGGHRRLLLLRRFWVRGHTFR